MANYGLSNTAMSNMSSAVSDVTVNSLNTDGATGQDEYSWQNNNWPKYWGYFNEIPELKNALITKSIWVVGKGYEADIETKVILDHISGWGKDTFKDILYNMDLMSRLAGDSFAEIISDEKTGLLLNLKVLDPGSIKIIVDKKGIIKRYEQTNKLSGGVIKFKPSEIFHLSHNRLADQIHGISDLISLQKTIDADNEFFTDNKKVMHRQAKPLIIFKLGTDDPAKISAFVSKMDAAVNKGENIYVPDDKNTFSYEVVQVNIAANTLAYGDSIRQRFYRSLGLPLSVFGAASGNESQSKIEYLAHEQVFAHDQRFIEEQVYNQLFLKIKLNSPVTLLENLQTDQSKDGMNQRMNIQPNDVTAGSGA
jgi:hypothetical protein